MKINKMYFFYKYLVTVLIIVGINFIVVFGQADKTAQIANVNNQAILILEKAKKSIYKKVKTEKINSLDLEYDFKTRRIFDDNEVKENTGEIKLFWVMPSQIRFEVYSDFITNQHLSTEILNLPKYSITSDILVDGKPFSFGSNLGSLSPKFTKDQRIESFKQTVFYNTFYIILKSSWNENLKFSYIGEAESKDFKAEIVEIEDINGAKFQLLFDKKNHLPVMMIDSLVNPVTKKKIERKSYFSDYKEIAGLMVAHKVVTQTGKSTTEERQLKKLEINPKFKAKLFEVKEDKINPY